MPTKLAQALSLLALACAAQACTPSSPPGDAGPASFPDCEAIVEACHDVDPGAGPAHDCHEAAHDAASNAECTPLVASCVAACAAIDAGAVDAGPDDHGGHSH